MVNYGHLHCNRWKRVNRMVRKPTKRNEHDLNFVVLTEMELAVSSLEGLQLAKLVRYMCAPRQAASNS